MMNSVAPGASAAMSMASPALEAFLMAAKWVYKKINEPKPIANWQNHPKYQDKTRYDDLCNLYRRHIYETMPSDWDIPPEWRLDERGCPVFETNFLESAGRLKIERDKLQVSTYPLVNSVSGMVASIEQLFQLLEARKSIFNQGYYKWKGYRADGFEVMFFTDLALWLSTALPRFPVYEQRTADEVACRIAYCDEVYDSVLMNRSDEKEAVNPKKLLNDIIVDLKGLHADICKAIKAASFNVKIQSISSAILSMSRYVFDLFYRLIEDTPEHELQIRALLRQDEKNRNKDTAREDKELQHLLKCQMGQWIVETLRKSGITSNNFENTKPIDIEMAHLHLSTDFSQFHNLKVTGLLEFARQNQDGHVDGNARVRAERYLYQIVEIHRLLLMVYYVRESIVLGALVSKDLGDAWVYGEDTGRGIIRALCQVILDSCSKLQNGIMDFWIAFYDRHYAPMYGVERDTSDPHHRNLIKAKNIVKRIEKDVKEIRKQLTQIEAQIQDYTQERNDILNVVRTLKHSLYDYVRITQLELEPELKREIERHVDNSSEPKVITVTRYIAPGEILEAQQQTVVEHNKASLPYYLNAERILNHAITARYPELVMLCSGQTIDQPASFLSEIQSNIYTQYLRPNHRVAALPAFLRIFSFFHGISPAKINLFLFTYVRINAVMRMIYFPPRSLSTVPYNLPVRPTAIEIMLIDILLNEKIRDDFIENEYYLFNAQLPNSPLEVNITDTLIQVTLAENWLNLVKSSLRVEFQVLIDTLNEKEARIAELVSQREGLLIDIAFREEELRQKDELIAKQGESIEAQTQLIETKNLELYEKTQQLQAAQQELRDLIRRGASDNRNDSTETDSGIPQLTVNQNSSFFSSMFRRSSISKFSVILKTFPSHLTTIGDIESDSPVLILFNEQYHFYGFSRGTWRVTILDTNVIRPLRLPFPMPGGEVIFNYDKAYKALFVEIHNKNAHNTNDLTVYAQQSAKRK